MRSCSEQEIANLEILETEGLLFASLRPSEVSLSKSILDATVPFRRFLSTAGIHDFDAQDIGPEHKRVIPIALVGSQGEAICATASLYRPRTKQGDPRIWITRLREIVQAGQLLSCFWYAGTLWAANASTGDLALVLSQAKSQLPRNESETDSQNESPFENLLEQLRKVGSKGFIPAPVSGPTAVGRLLEAELGIKMNSSKEPDFHGIEIKSARAGGRRATMFAQVPDWARSSFTSSRELLEAFGYDKPEGRTLSCTISVPRVNSQGLFLHVDRDEDILRVRHDEFDPREVVQWDMKHLQQRLAFKHSETAWVEADVRHIGTQEYLRFRGVHHTKSPRPDQLESLIIRGQVTVDFLIRPDSDKGYLFKVELDRLKSLFTHSKRYVLF